MSRPACRNICCAPAPDLSSKLRRPPSLLLLIDGTDSRRTDTRTFDNAYHLLRGPRNNNKVSPWGRRDDMPPPLMVVRSKNNLGESTSVRGRTSLMAGGVKAASSQLAYSLGWDRQMDRQTDGSQYRLMPPTQGCSGAGTRWNAVPANILEPKRRSGKYRWPQVER